MEHLNSDRAAKPIGTFPHARRVGELLFLSGIGPRKRETNEVPGLVRAKNGEVQSYDFRAQCLATFENVKYVLEDCGSKWENIVDVLVFLTDMKSDFPLYNQLWTEYFSNVQATRTTIEVGSLPTPIAIELKVIATIESMPARAKSDFLITEAI